MQNKKKKSISADGNARHDTQERVNLRGGVPSLVARGFRYHLQIV